MKFDKKCQEFVDWPDPMYPCIIVNIGSGVSAPWTCDGGLGWIGGVGAAGSVCVPYAVNPKPQLGPLSPHKPTATNPTESLPREKSPWPLRAPANGLWTSEVGV